MEKSNKIFLFSTHDLFYDIYCILNKYFTVTGVFTQKRFIDNLYGIDQKLSIDSDWIKFFDKNLVNYCLLVVCGFPQKIPESVLCCFSNGGINIHPSYLPNYRGRNPLIQIFKNQTPYTSITIHKVTNEIDSGPIAFQNRLAIQTPYSFQNLVDITNSLMLSTLNQFCSLMIKNKLSFIEQVP